VSREDIRRGHVCCHPTNPVKVAKSFIGRIFVLYHPTAIAAGYTPVLHIHTATVAVRFDQILKKIDPRSGATIEENPAFIKQGDAAIVKFVPLKPVCLEKYSDIPQLGRFAIRDMGRTIAAGIVMEIEE
ncbi:MAG: elongation factor 1-alpha, partial [Candidatus Methanomethylicia archaeon]